MSDVLLGWRIVAAEDRAVTLRLVDPRAAYWQHRYNGSTWAVARPLRLRAGVPTNVFLVMRAAESCRTDGIAGVDPATLGCEDVFLSATWRDGRTPVGNDAIYYDHGPGARSVGERVLEGTFPAAAPVDLAWHLEGPSGSGEPHFNRNADGSLVAHAGDQTVPAEDWAFQGWVLRVEPTASAGAP
jgi:hypothetical protein